MSASNKILQAAAGNAAGGAVYIEDVFSTYLYEGTGATLSINNGLDLDGEGGLVWIKERTDTGQHHFYDTERGATKRIHSNSTAAEATQSDALTAFNSNGFTLGTNSQVNDSGIDTCSWSFRKQAGFFDVVTYTGNGTAGRTVSHNLGSVPGCIIVKSTSTTGNWMVYHRGTASDAETDVIRLNLTDAAVDTALTWNDTAPTSTEFTLGTSSDTNNSGTTYVAYLFAHDDQSFGDDSDESIIKCGSYTGTGSSGNSINVGFEPQWLMVKAASGGNASGQNWALYDMMRGFNMGDDAYLEADTSDAEANWNDLNPTATGFVSTSNSGNRVNESGTTYIYIAIRRPMKTPEAGTDVFAVDDAANGLTSGFPVDWFIRRTFSNSQNYTHTRLCGETFLTTDSTDAEQASSPSFDNNEGVYAQLNNSAIYGWMFKRATGFFDVVAYTGTEVSGRTISHNLGVIPELIICKGRNQSGTDWTTYDSASGATKYMQLNSSAAAGTYTAMWNDTAPTASVFTVGDSATTNGPSNYNYVAYLFATVAGVSKVGSYTGTGSDQNIDCGFSSGARFVLIKRTDDTAHWNLFDSVEQGIVAGNDPHIRLNANTAQETADDLVDPYSSGFTVTGSNGNVNASGGSYIFLAIA